MTAKALKFISFRHKNAVFYAICLSLIFTLAGCQSVSEQRETRNLLDLIDYFDNNGLRADKIIPTRYQTLLASNGCALMIQGAKVEFYIYDINDKIQRKKLEKIKKEKTIPVLALDIPVAVNGGFVMLTYSNHPNKAKIVRAFKEFPLDYKRKKK